MPLAYRHFAHRLLGDDGVVLWNGPSERFSPSIACPFQPFASLKEVHKLIGDW